MKKLAAIIAVFTISTAFVAVQTEASGDYGISPIQHAQSKIIHADKAKISYHSRHKTQAKHEIKAHFIPVLTGEQAKENIPSGFKTEIIYRTKFLGSIFNIRESEALFRSNLYKFILKTRK